jgi:hypothetical protein
MKQWKIALSLAVFAAIAAPFVFGTWKMRPTSNTWTPLSAEEKTKIAAYMESTRNCQTTADRLRALEPNGPNLLSDDNYLKDLSCRMDREALSVGGRQYILPSTLKYVTENSAIALGGFLSIYVLAFVVPLLVRRYWRWLST